MAHLKDDAWRKKVKGRLQEAMWKSDTNAYRMGKELGISKGTLYYILGGSSGCPTSEVIYAVCKHLSISADWVMGLTDDEPPLNKKYADMLNTYRRFLLAVQRKEEKEKNHVGAMESEEKAADEPVRAGTAGDGTGHQRDGGQDS